MAGKMGKLPRPTATPGDPTLFGAAASKAAARTKVTPALRKAIDAAEHLTELDLAACALALRLAEEVDAADAKRAGNALASYVRSLSDLLGKLGMMPGEAIMREDVTTDEPADPWADIRQLSSTTERAS